MIAIIDNGVNTTDELCFDLVVQENGTVVHREKDKNYWSHGSVCAAIIKKYVPNAKIGSLCIYSDESNGTVEKMISALKWCLHHEVRVVNISCGFTPSTMPPTELFDIIEELLQRGTAIFAAYSNENIYTFPACIEGVVGVKAHRQLKGMDIYRIPQSPYDVSVVASSGHLLSQNNDEYVYSAFGNSYACAFTTAMYLNANVPDVSAFLEALAEKEDLKDESNMLESSPVVSVIYECAEDVEIVTRICHAICRRGYRVALLASNEAKDRYRDSTLLFPVSNCSYIEAARKKLNVSLLLIDAAGLYEAETDGKILISDTVPFCREKEFCLSRRCSDAEIDELVSNLERVF